MGKPRLLIIVRHGQSEGNKNRDIHQTVPDHRVRLTSEGWQQAYDAGRRLRTLLRADDTIQFFTSPYRRTRETTEGILQTLTSDNPEPSPFKRNNIKVYEEPRLREQDFGNFQPCSAEMERMWQERADYGHFFYRIPNGESAADAYDRVSGFNESLWRQFGEEDFPSVCVLVTHGLMSRVFLMKWYHFSVEYFEDLRNVNHCEFLIMRKQGDSGKYKLESKLRTWSELRRERAALLKQKEELEAAKDKTTDKTDKTLEKGDKDSAKLEKAASGLSSSSPSSSTLVPQRRWGGCPNGCNHDKNFKIRPGLADLIKRDGTNVYDSPNSGSGSSPRSSKLTSAINSHSHSHGKSSATPPSLSRRVTAVRRFQVAGYSDDDDGGDGGDEVDDDNRPSSQASNDTNNDAASKSPKEPLIGGSGSGSSTKLAANNKSTASAGGGLVPPHIDITRAREEIVSSPDATPSFITPEDRQRTVSPGGSPPPLPKPFLHIGRDFGGTYSGHTSDADSSEDDRVRYRMARLKMNIGGTAESGAQHSHSHGHGHGHGHSHNHNHNHSHGSVQFYGTLDAVAATATSGKAEVIAAVATGQLERGSATPGSAGGSSSNLSNIRKKRTKNMANRLGDAPHCSDCEHDHGDTTDLGADELDMDDELLSSGVVVVDDNGDDETDIDPDLALAEKEDKSIQGSVY
ncbi:hypothetical protein Sste5346_001862 [Sporothrix stenoceras]|uniref:Phosphoglycerate mutase family domain containing protein n=1 Tax=Sporothrix stenoceras TaxID=5173 RepID=A0ABR3ZMR9_9PEZI